MSTCGEMWRVRGGQLAGAEEMRVWSGPGEVSRPKFTPGSMASRLERASLLGLFMQISADFLSFYADIQIEINLKFLFSKLCFQSLNRKHHFHQESSSFKRKRFLLSSKILF